MQIVNLESTAHLNGSEATCEDWDADAGRWTVKFYKDGALRRVKPENLLPLEYVQLRITDSSGMLLYVTVGLKWQVSLVKSQIEKMRCDCPRIEQRLICDGEEPLDDEEVGDVRKRSTQALDEVLSLTLIRKPSFTAVVSETKAADQEEPAPSDASVEARRKPDSGAAIPFSNFEGSLRASGYQIQAGYVAPTLQGQLLAGPHKGKGPGKGKGGQYVAMRVPGLAAGMRTIH